LNICGKFVAKYAQNTIEAFDKMGFQEASLGMTKTTANANASMVTGPIGVYDIGI
jgi:hypothetical protein